MGFLKRPSTHGLQSLKFRLNPIPKFKNDVFSNLQFPLDFSLPWDSGHAHAFEMKGVDDAARLACQWLSRVPLGLSRAPARAHTHYSSLGIINGEYQKTDISKASKLMNLYST